MSFSEVVHVDVPAPSVWRVVGPISKFGIYTVQHKETKEIRHIYCDHVKPRQGRDQLPHSLEQVSLSVEPRHDRTRLPKPKYRQIKDMRRKYMDKVETGVYKNKTEKRKRKSKPKGFKHDHDPLTLPITEDTCEEDEDDNDLYCTYCGDFLCFEDCLYYESEEYYYDSDDYYYDSDDSDDYYCSNINRYTCAGPN